MCVRFFFTGIVEFFFVDTTPFVEKYFTDPEEHTYDWNGVLPRESYRAKLLKVNFNNNVNKNTLTSHVWYHDEFIEITMSNRYFA